VKKGVIDIRTVRPDDDAEIQEVHLLGRPAVAKLVRLITGRQEALTSLVAVSEEFREAEC
jgi:hypothetical protein